MATFTVGVPTPPPATGLPPSHREHAPLPRNTATAHLHALVEREPHEWTSLLCRFSHDGRHTEALALFREMMLRRSCHRGRRPEAPSLGVVLRSCAAVGAAKSGREVHAFVMRNAEWLSDARHAESSLINFYGRCGRLLDARLLFDGMPARDVVAWTVMLMAYARCDSFEGEMPMLFEQMLFSGVEPNPHTFTTILRRVKLLQGHQLHGHIVKRSLDSDAFVGNALVDMYVKHGVLDYAERVFNGIRDKDAACFNSLISGYGRTGDTEGLVSAFLDMGMAGLAANQATYVGLLNGCASLGAISLSQQLHAYVIVNGFSSDVIVQGALLDMYAKCGDLEAARATFDRLDTTGTSVVTWNSMIGAYGKHGQGKGALQVFRLMQMAGVRPDYITFTCLLSACSHSGLVDEGWRLFKLMGEVYMIPPRNEHYCCVVDLLGRAGMIREAYKVILGMGCMVGASIWGALLNSCGIWGDVEIAEIAAEQLFELEPSCSGSYVALAGIYAANGRWNDAAAVRELMERRGIKKETGRSWTETEREVNSFRAGKINDHHDVAELHPPHATP